MNKVLRGSATALMSALPQHELGGSVFGGTDHVKCIELLLEAGADFNIGYQDTTALNLASRCGLYEVIDLLIRAGADVNKVSEDSFTPIMEASGYSGEGGTPDATECMNLLIEAGADVNAITCRGSALTISVFYGVGIEQPQLLIGAGADVNFAHSNGKTALMFISTRIKGWVNICNYSKLLLRSGAKINIVNSGLGNALRQHLKYYHVDKKLCQLLFAAGETLDGVPDEKIPDCLKFGGVRLDLKHICREAIRKHLLKLDPHAILFNRVPRLGLPSVLIDICCTTHH